MRTYEAPELFVDEYVADTMIASSSEWEALGGIGSAPKNGNAGNNQNCWSARCYPGHPDPTNRENVCTNSPLNPTPNGDYSVC